MLSTTSTWTGMGADANWSTPGNWDVPPTSGAGTNLIFPAGALQLTNVDDMGPASTFGELSFTGGGYSISPASGTTSSFTSIDSAQTTSNANTFSVPIPLSQATIVTVDNALGSLVLGGVISGSSGITTAGNGTVNLTADNTYTGTTTVNTGTLLVDGNQNTSDVLVNAGATLGGKGTLKSITATNGTINPGNPAPGILTDAGALSLQAASSNNSTFKVVLDGSNPGNGTGFYTQLQAAGAIGLSGVNLVGTLGSDFTPTLGSTYTILDNTGTAGSTITGTFNGQAEGSTVLISSTPFKISYVGGTNNNSVVLTELDASQTVVTFTPSSPVFGQSVALTATVTGPAGSPTPTGSVQFFNGTTSLGTMPLGADGTATLNVTSLPAASNSITAKYAGDTNFAGSTSIAVPVVVAKATTTTTVTPSTTNPVFGQPVNFTATVLPVSPGAGTPTGTVQFFNGSTSLGTQTLASGSASLATSTLATGANSITVVYSGDGSFSGQTSTAITVTVGKASTLSTLTTAPTSPVFGQSVTLTARLGAVSPGTGTPTGTVQFKVGSTLLGTATLSAGSANLTTSSLPTGTDTVTMVYSGDTNFQTSTSTGTVTIGHAATSTTLTVSNINPAANQPVTLTANVANTSPGVGTPTGTVDFLNNGVSIGTATISGGTATLTTTLPTAVNSITAQYNGDSNFSSSTSTATTVAAGSANDQWLNRVFQILLNRSITPAEITFWNKQFARGRSRYSIANEISQGKEAKIAALQNSFNLYLGQDGTSAQLTAAVRAAKRTNTSTQAAILGSDTFYKFSGGTATFFYQSLNFSVLGTTFPNRHLENLISEGVPRIRVANALLQSNLGRQSLLTATYNTVLNRDPTQPEVRLYLSQMKNQHVLLRSIQNTLLASSEFFVKATSPTSS